MPAKSTRKTKTSPAPPGRLKRFADTVARVWRWVWLGLVGLVALSVLIVLLARVVNPPINIYQWQESRRLGGITRQWVPIDQISPHMPRALIAAEDANFCRHWGFDMTEIRRVIEQGSNRGASTISQQVAKNVFLWHGRTMTRKALESGFTLLIEGMWPKRRILEVYLNVAEFDSGVFGVEAAARRYFNTSAAELTPLQAARLAAVLPAPQRRDAANPTQFLRQRTSAIMDGAATISRDGRDDCIGD
jgi:monofunctional biosynthetic peptidoglycan transglycosylase